MDSVANHSTTSTNIPSLKNDSSSNDFNEVESLVDPSMLTFYSSAITPGPASVSGDQTTATNAAIMTERYETCTPDIIHCPNYICDDLEYLDHRICPQDCTIECNILSF